MRQESNRRQESRELEVFRLKMAVNLLVGPDKKWNSNSILHIYCIALFRRYENFRASFGLLLVGVIAFDLGFRLQFRERRWLLGWFG